MAVPVPELLDDVLSPGWLTEALGTRYPGIEVTGVWRGPEVSRVATNARFRIECRDGLPAGLPARLCAKGYYAAAGQPFRPAGEPAQCGRRRRPAVGRGLARLPPRHRPWLLPVGHHAEGRPGGDERAAGAPRHGGIRPRRVRRGPGLGPLRSRRSEP